MGRLVRAFAAAALVGWVSILGAPALAQGLIRDAEIEATLKRLSYPMFRAAGLNPALVRIYIVNDPQPNAFVAAGQSLFIHTGLVLKLKSMDQLRAVIAHEVGHIAGGHVARRDQALGGARGIAAIGVLTALAAAAGGAPEAGVAIAAGTGGAAQRAALAHSRAEEASADQAGLRFIAAAGGDPKAFLEVLRLFQGQQFLISSGVDAYAQTHPLWSERIALLEEKIAQMPDAPPPDPEVVYWYDRMVAKFAGFLRTPRETLKRYPEADGSEAALLARAVAYHRQPDVARALAAADALVAARPDDPYYRELRGQFLLESGRAPAAVSAFREATALAPNEPLILGGLGRALLNLDTADASREAADVLRRAYARDRANPELLRDLALAEARLGNEGLAALATAERFVLAGDPRDALRQADRAAALLPAGSPGWKRAQDVTTMAQRALDR